MEQRAGLFGFYRDNNVPFGLKDRVECLLPTFTLEFILSNANKPILKLHNPVIIIISYVSRLGRSNTYTNLLASSGTLCYLQFFLATWFYSIMASSFSFSVLSLPLSFCSPLYLSHLSPPLSSSVSLPCLPPSL